MKALQKTAISAAAVALLTGLTSVAAFAEEAAAPEVSPVTANVTVASSYIYRGITQSNNKPAIQGGFDYAHESVTVLQVFQQLLKPPLLLLKWISMPVSKKN